LIDKKYFPWHDYIVVHLKIHHSLSIHFEEYDLTYHDNSIESEYPEMIPELFLEEDNKKYLPYYGYKKYKLVRDGSIEEANKILIS
jgi:hypothetical protein